MKNGDRVKVASPVGKEDKTFEGKTGTFVEYTKPHGFARLHLDGEPETMRVLVHPESVKPEN